MATATMAPTNFHTSTTTCSGTIKSCPSSAGAQARKSSGGSTGSMLSIRIPRADTTPCGRLVLGRQLQSGAHGTVCVATSISTGHLVAVKVAHSDMDSINRLAKEADILASLPAHRHVVATYPTALPASRCRRTQAVYLPMELCDTDLLELLLTERMDTPTVIRFARQLTSALRHSHAHGVFHLDVKPENVLVDVHRGDLKLADFGMALHLKGKDAKHLIGQHGSASYAAPEVWVPEDAGLEVSETGVDAAAADVWSLGAVIFTMVFGRRCWTQVSLIDKDFRHYANTGDFLMYGQEAERVDDDMLGLLKRMLHMDPAQRPSLAEVADWLDAAAGQGIDEVLAFDAGVAQEVVCRGSRVSHADTVSVVSPMSMSCGSVSPTGASLLSPVGAEPEEDDVVMDAM